MNGLKDHRHSNNYKLTQDQKEKLVKVKDTDRWRSARNVRDKLNLSVVTRPEHQCTIVARGTSNTCLPLVP